MNSLNFFKILFFSIRCNFIRSREKQGWKSGFFLWIRFYSRILSEVKNKRLYMFYCQVWCQVFAPRTLLTRFPIPVLFVLVERSKMLHTTIHFISTLFSQKMYLTVIFVSLLAKNVLSKLFIHDISQIDTLKQL